MLYYHDYTREEAFAGAGLGYAEISELIKEKIPDAMPLSFNQIIEEIPSMEEKDVLLTNIGPYAWYFHYLRQKHNKQFSIIRDARTTFWSGYLLQESLISDKIRNGDIIYFPSEFTRQAYIKFFPHINKENSCTLSPIFHFFPKDNSKKVHNSLNLGWVGSVSKEKGFDSAVKIFASVYSRLGKDVNLIVCGECKSNAYSELNIKTKLKSAGIDPDSYHHINSGEFASLSQVYETFRNIDVLLFPSTANIEAMPRVVLEASYFGVPIISSDYAEGYGLIPKENQVKTNYTKKSDNLINNQPLGEIDIKGALKKLENPSNLKVADISLYSSHPEEFIKLLKREIILSSRDSKNKSYFSLNSYRLNISFNPKVDYERLERCLLKSDIRNMGNTALNLCNLIKYKAHLTIFAH